MFFPETPILLRNGSNLTKNNQLGGKKKQLDLVPISVGFPIQYLLGFVFQMYFQEKVVLVKVSTIELIIYSQFGVAAFPGKTSNFLFFSERQGQGLTTKETAATAESWDLNPVAILRTNTLLRHTGLFTRNHWRVEWFFGRVIFWNHNIVLRNKSTRTPGTYPKYARIQIRKDFLKKTRVVEGLVYVPGVCWNFLRMMIFGKACYFRQGILKQGSL